MKFSCPHLYTDTIVRNQGYQKAQYHVSPVNQGYYSWQYDDEVRDNQQKQWKYAVFQKQLLNDY